MDIDIQIIRRTEEKKGARSWMCESYHRHSSRRFCVVCNRWLVPLGEDPKAGLLMQSTDWTHVHLGDIEITGLSHQTGTCLPSLLQQLPTT